MTGVVYLLSAATCLLCAVMLFRGYLRSRVRLLFWAGICFVGLMADNFTLYIDGVLYPEVNLAVWNKVLGLIGLVILVYGLVWESK
jgi:hydrogenase/urease accessory protein HupE